MTVSDFIITLPDIPRIYTALAEWLACLICILALPWRFDWKKMSAVSVLFLAVQTVFLVITDGAEGFVWNLCMAAAVALMFCYIRACAEVTSYMAVCCCAAAFIASEFMASFEWQIWCYLHEYTEVDSVLLQAAVLIFIYAAVCFIIWKLDRRIFMTEEGVEITRRESLIMAVSAVLIFGVSNLGFLPVRIPFAGRDSIEIFNMRTLIDLGGLAMLYAYQAQWKSICMQRELETIQTMMHSQYEQYKQAQRTVDLINYRYHDLKNHIIALRSEADANDRQAYLDKLEHEIHDYEALNKTGNQVLDTLLTSKNLRCMQHKIDMTCVVDGTLFDFMDVMDICAVFGNALDNAIECELKIPDYKKRMIHVDAFSEKSFLIIRIENYYEGAIRFERGFPVTTKAEKAVHGYGLKSLRYTVHKYKGEVQIDAKDNWFSLRILIPMDIKSK